MGNTIFQNLTEFNTAHNRRITALADLPETAPTPKLKRRRAGVRFNEDEEVINPGNYSKIKPVIHFCRTFFILSASILLIYSFS